MKNIETASVGDLVHYWKCHKDIKKMTHDEFNTLKIVHDKYFEKTTRRFPDFNTLNKINIT